MPVALLETLAQGLQYATVSHLGGHQKSTNACVCIVPFSLISSHKLFPAFNMEQELKSWNSKRLKHIRAR